MTNATTSPLVLRDKFTDIADASIMADRLYQDAQEGLSKIKQAYSRALADESRLRDVDCRKDVISLCYGTTRRVSRSIRRFKKLTEEQRAECLDFQTSITTLVKTQLTTAEEDVFKMFLQKQIVSLVSSFDSAAVQGLLETLALGAEMLRADASVTARYLKILNDTSSWEILAAWKNRIEFERRARTVSAEARSTTGSKTGGRTSSSKSKMKSFETHHGDEVVPPDVLESLKRNLETRMVAAKHSEHGRQRLAVTINVTGDHVERAITRSQIQASKLNDSVEEYTKRNEMESAHKVLQRRAWHEQTSSFLSEFLNALDIAKRQLSTASQS